MDSRRFDTLIRALVASGSRRGAIRLLVGLGFGGTVTPLGAERVAAACGLVRTSEQGASRCQAGKPCCENARCKNHRCKCKAGWCDTDDDGVCESPIHTNANCNHCGDACDEFQECTHDFGGPTTVCCRPLQQLCDVDQSGAQCCLHTGTLSCRAIANNKGGNFGCGFLEQPNPPTRCCIPDGGVGASGDCDCCGASVSCEGACIPAACANTCTKSCATDADCGCGNLLTCQEEGGAGGPKRCHSPF